MSTALAIPNSPTLWTRARSFVQSIFARRPAAALDREVAAIRTSSPFNPYAQGHVLPGIRPQHLAAVLEAADAGDLIPYLTAAAELEERDAQYGSQLFIRRAAVMALELRVERPPGCTKAAFELVRDWVGNAGLSPLTPMLLDALGKGYACAEIVWDTSGRYWLPTFHERDPRQFQFDRITGRELRLRDHSFEGQPLEPFKWVQHYPGIRNGLPARGGLARTAMFLHMAKSLSLAGWCQLLALYGVPLTVAMTNATLSDNDRSVIQAALGSLGRGMSAVLPSSIDLKVIQAANAGQSGHLIFLALCEYLDKQLTKTVLGQTMTADDGASHAQATVHNEVRKDVVEFDAERIDGTYNCQVIQPMVQLNLGEQRVYPRVRTHVEHAVDLTKLSAAIIPWLDRGLKVRVSDLFELFPFTRPSEGDETIGGKAPERASQPTVAEHGRYAGTVRPRRRWPRKAIALRCSAGSSSAKWRWAATQTRQVAGER